MLMPGFLVRAGGFDAHRRFTGTLSRAGGEGGIKPDPCVGSLGSIKQGTFEALVKFLGACCDLECGGHATAWQA